MKKKAMIMAVASLGSMALIGTGFAGWVISTSTTTNADGVMVAYDVKDQRFEVATGKWTNGKEGAATGEKANIVFGKSKTAVTNQWLHYDAADMETESLSDTYEFKVSSKDNSDAGSFKVALSTGAPGGFVVTDTNDKAWEKATTGETTAVKAMPNIEYLDDDSTVDGKYTFVDGTATVKMKITFGWGTAFGGINPFDYYNGKEATEENVKAAVNSLNLVKALNDVAFTVNLVIDRVAA